MKNEIALIEQLLLQDNTADTRRTLKSIKKIVLNSEKLKAALQEAADNYVTVTANTTQASLKSIYDCAMVRNWYEVLKC